MNKLYDMASYFNDLGFSFFPISAINRKPLCKWKEFQTRRPDAEEYENWFEVGAPAKSEDDEETRLVKEFNLGIVTGEISNLVVIDCDSDEAEAWWREHGQWTPVTVKTMRGRHFYYQHPNRYVKNGTNVFTAGLDVRGDGGFVVAPGSKRDAHIYKFEIEIGHGIEDMPVLENMSMPETAKDASVLADLSHVKAEGATILDEAEAHLLKHGKYADGDGRNNIMTKYAGELINQGHTDETLERNCHRFMDRFFCDPLDAQELSVILRSIRMADITNKPENYKDGKPVLVHDEEDGRAKRVEFAGVFTPKQITELELPENDFLIEPFLINKSIVQVYGYAGHGKSLVTCAALYCLARGISFGPYYVKTPKKVLYIDYDMGMRDQFKRMTDFQRMFGDTGENFVLVSRAAMAKESISMDIRKEDGWNNLVDLIEHFNPDVVCLDNLRTICDGMDEAKSHEWSTINSRLMKIRDALGKTIIYLHHSNKPQRDSSGKEHVGSSAGSSNQVTPLEVQLRIAKVENEQEEIYGTIEQKLRDNHGSLSFIRHLAEISYGKVRDFDPELHKTEYVAFCRTDGDGRAIVASSSNRQKMAIMLRMGQPLTHIAQTLKVSVATMEKWQEEMGIV